MRRMFRKLRRLLRRIGLTGRDRFTEHFDENTCRTVMCDVVLNNTHVAYLFLVVNGEISPVGLLAEECRFHFHAEGDRIPGYIVRNLIGPSSAMNMLIGMLGERSSKRSSTGLIIQYPNTRVCVECDDPRITYWGEEVFYNDQESVILCRWLDIEMSKPPKHYDNDIFQQG